MSIAQSNARRERARAHASRDRLIIGDTIREYIAERTADYLADRIESELCALFTQDARDELVGALVPILEAAVDHLALPPIGSGEIGGPVEPQVA